MMKDAPAIAERIAHWVAGFRLSHAPAAVVVAARRCLLDGIGVSIAGSRHPTARRMRGFLWREYALGPCTVLGEADRRCGTAGAALANGVAAHAWDFDDVSYEGMVHGTAVIWPAIFAAAEACDASGERLLEAFIVGVEVDYALGRAFGEAMFWKGWWTTGLLGSIGAAAGAAKAGGLDAGAVAHAIGFAAAQATSAKTVIGTPLKPYACGRAAEAGVHAALFAAAGLAAPRHAFEDENGLIALANDGRFAGDELARLGQRWVLEDGVAFKMFPLCSAAQAAAEAAQRLVEEDGVRAGDIATIACEVTPVVAGHLEFPRPRTVAEAQFSLSFAIGCALLHGEITTRHLDATTLDDARLLTLMAGVRMISSPRLAATAEDRRDYPEAAILTVQLRDGRRLVCEVMAATGMPKRPPSLAQLERKFLACAAESLTPPDALQLIERISAIDRLASARMLFLPSEPER